MGELIATAVVPGVTHLDTEAVQAMAERLRALADEVRAVPTDELAPPIPEDVFGLGGLIRSYVTARSAFGQRVAELLDGAGEQALVQVYDATGADRRFPYRPLPESLRSEP